MPFTAYAGNNVHKSTLMNAWHRLWHTLMLENEHFGGFITSSDKQMVSNIVTYVKILSAKSVSKLEEAAIEEMLNTDKDALLVHSLGHGENAEMVLNTD
jgi:hypothetical protein